jgi:hypothetical protein
MKKKAVKYATQPKRKLSVIENYFEQGLLNTVAGKFTPEYRLAAGLQLARDFYQSRLQTISAINCEKDRVDMSISADEPAFVLDARTRYTNAIKDVPAEFWGVVSDVCCFDKLIKGIGQTKQQKLYNRNMKICDLCRGLDYIIKGYLSNGWRL